MATDSEKRNKKTCAACPAMHYRGMRDDDTVLCAFAQTGGVDLRKESCPLGFWGTPNVKLTYAKPAGVSPPVTQRHHAPVNPPPAPMPAILPRRAGEKDWIPPADLEDAPDAHLVRAAAKSRALVNLTVCGRCPGRHFVKQDGPMGSVCEVGHECCGGKRDRGTVSRGYGSCPNNFWPATPPGNPLHHAFDRVVLINLKRRPDRLIAFRKMMEEVQWPFREPELFYGVDGAKVPAAEKWGAGGGAWGCMQSHRQILERAILDDVRSLLVLEDDAFVLPNFVSDVSKFLSAIPNDWDQLMLGGQHISNPLPTEIPGVVRCTNAQRTHAYGIRGRFMKDLYKKWVSSAGHCDHIMGPMQKAYRVYAPAEFLIGQADGKSDISGGNNPKKLWVNPKKDAPVVFIHCKRQVMDAIRDQFHSGRMRDAHTAVDVGLKSIFEDKTLDRAAAVGKLRKWITMIQWEAASMGAHCTIWYPDAPVETVRAAVGEHLVEFSAETADEARAYMAEVLMLNGKA